MPIILILFFLFSCSPRYETTYKLHPIEEPEGQDCVEACEFSKEVCAKTAIERRRQCRYWSEVKYTRCLSRRVFRFSRRTNSSICVANCVCFREFCRLNSESCKSEYRDCHVGCGGKITKEKKCIKFCEEAEADSTSLIDERESK